MKDIEIRGAVLEALYERRRNQLVNFEEELNALNIPPDDLQSIIGQLHEKGLVNWRFRAMGGLGAGSITAQGIDVVEGSSAPPLPIILHQVTVQGSSQVQIGTGNIQNVSDVEKLYSAIDHSEASSQEKAEAKSLIEKLGKNKLVLAAFKGLGWMLTPFH